MNEMLDRNSILLKIKKKDKYETLIYLSEVLYKNGFITDSQLFYEDVLLREKASTTYIGNSIAIPHARSSHVAKSIVVFAHMDKPIQWDDKEESLAKIIFLFVVQEKEIELYIKMLSRVSKLLMNEKVIQQLITSNDIDEVMNLLNVQKLPQ